MYLCVNARMNAIISELYLRPGRKVQKAHLLQPIWKPRGMVPVPAQAHL